MTDQTSITAACKYPGCEATPSGRPGRGARRNTALIGATTR